MVLRCPNLSTGGVVVKKVSLLLVIVFLSLVGVRPAMADMGMQCTEDMTTVASLRMCVQHAYDQGFIYNKGVAKSLLTQLDNAQAAVDAGQTGVAISMLQTFIVQVESLAGVQIDPDHAQHMVHHAEMVIEALAAQ
jgi:FIMAH domain